MPQGDPRALLDGLAAGLKNAIDAGTLKAANETKAFARVVMRQALGARAANTIGLKSWPDPTKPLAEGLYSRWWQDGEDIPYAFSVGATIRPVNRRFLAIPSDEARAGILPTSTYQPGQLPALGRRPVITTGAGERQSVGVRLSPRSFEYKTGVKLRYVPPGGGRRFGMLVVENARLTPRGQVRGSRRRTPRYSYIAFLLVPETKLPQRLEWGQVIDRAGDLLEQDVLDAIQTAVIDGVPQFTVNYR